MKKKIKILIIISIICISLITFFTIYGYKKCNDKRKEQELINEYQTFYQNKLTSFEEENKKYAPYEVDVAFLGDSLTDMCDVEKYYPDYICVNRGISGDTTISLEERLQVSVFDLKPKVIVLLIGANNFTTMFDNYERILQKIKENLPETKVIQLSLTSMSKSWGKNNNQAAFNNVIIKELAEKYNNTYVDLFSLLLDFETKEIVEEYTIDGGHFTEQGYMVLTAEVNKVLKTVLDNIGDQND